MSRNSYDPPTSADVDPREGGVGKEEPEAEGQRSHDEEVTGQIVHTL